MRIPLKTVIVFSLLTTTLWSAQWRSFSDYTPDETILFAEVQDLEAVWDAVVDSNLWRKLSSLESLEDKDVPDKITEIEEEFKSLTGFSLSRENLMSLMGKRFAIAVYAQPGEKGRPVSIEVVIIAQTNPKHVVDEIISELADKAKKEIGHEALFTSVIYNTKKIHSIKPKGEDINVEIRYVYDGDILIFGVGNMRPRIEKYLDCSIKKANSLERLPQYLKVKTITAPIRGAPFLTIYIDMAKLNTIKEKVNQEDLDILAIVDRISNLLGTGSAAGFSVAIDRGIRTKTIVLPTKERSSELQKIRSAVQPAAGVNRNYIPSETLLYLVANNMPDPVKAYPEVVKTWQADPKRSFLAQSLEQIEMSLDIEIRNDVLPFVGDEMAFLFAGVETEKYDFPMPIASIMIKVKDRDKAAAFVDKLTKAIRDNMPEGSPKIEFKPEHHEGTRIFTLEIPNPIGPDAESIKPCYVFMDDFLVIGSSVEQVRSMIDVSKGRKRGLVGTTIYRMSGTPERTNTVIFINWAEITENAKSVTQWLIKFAESRGMGDEVKEKIEDYVDPIIDVLSVIKHISAYVLNTSQGEETNWYIRLEDLPAI